MDISTPTAGVKEKCSTWNIDRIAATVVGVAIVNEYQQADELFTWMVQVCVFIAVAGWMIAVLVVLHEIRKQLRGISAIVSLAATNAPMKAQWAPPPVPPMPVVPCLHSVASGLGISHNALANDLESGDFVSGQTPPIV